jgi:hypothetical protein
VRRPRLSRELKILARQRMTVQAKSEFHSNQKICRK